MSDVASPMSWWHVVPRYFNTTGRQLLQRMDVWHCTPERVTEIEDGELVQTCGILHKSEDTAAEHCVRINAKQVRARSKR